MIQPSSQIINWRRATNVLAAIVFILPLVGCTTIGKLCSDNTGLENGKIYFVGGAGPIGAVTGCRSVPLGLREAGYAGAIEIFGWQSTFGGTLRDQIDYGRNQKQALRLAAEIADYKTDFPDKPVDIIALSAGTGIATWAVQNLPEDVHVRHMVFLGSSLSRYYPLESTFERVDGKIWNFFSIRDSVLKFGLPIAGSVDREFTIEHIAGLTGFAPSLDAAIATQTRYSKKLKNMPWGESYARFGNHGQHTDSVKQAFVTYVIAPILK